MTLTDRPTQNRLTTGYGKGSPLTARPARNSGCIPGPTSTSTATASVKLLRTSIPRPGEWPARLFWRRHTGCPPHPFLSIRCDCRGAPIRSTVASQERGLRPRPSAPSVPREVGPVGVFQPSSDAVWNRANDFSLWKAIAREMSEELLGNDENYGSDTQPIDYDHWPFYRELQAARENGTLRAYWFGLGIDPLTLVADMLTVAVFDSAVFDRTFTELVTSNDEGRMLSTGVPGGDNVGVPFNAETIERFVNTEPIQPAGAALLRLAWEHHTELLAPQSR
jgi:hypothetical protein